MNYFDGKTIRDQILKKIADENALRKRPAHLAVILAGDNPVCAKYVELKKKSAIKCGITFSDYLFNNGEAQEEIIGCIKHLNDDDEIDGIMIQIPVDEKYDRDELIKAISPKKDVDGLRYCLGLDSDFKPPVVEAVLEALIQAQGQGTRNEERGKITIIGQGFLVGKPLLRALEEQKVHPVVILNLPAGKAGGSEESPTNVGKFPNKLGDPSPRQGGTQDDTMSADVIISAVGIANLIQPDMIRDDVALIDAGTTEANGCLVGDIDPECYKKASFYTPVPGGIGPVTIAKLFENLSNKG